MSSCNQNTFNTEEALLDYITNKKNGYIQHKSVNGYDFSLLYRPTDLLVKQEFNDEKISKFKIDSLRNKYNKYLYFNLSMSKNNTELLSVAPKNKSEFGAMVNQLAFGIGDKVHLYTKTKDTIELADFIYPRIYGMSQATTIMFVYPRDEKLLNEEYFNFTIEDLGLYTGEIKFKLPTEIIKHNTQLSF